MGLAPLLSSQAGTSALLHCTGKLRCRKTVQCFKGSFDISVLVCPAWSQAPDLGYSLVAIWQISSLCRHPNPSVDHNTPKRSYLCCLWKFHPISPNAVTSQKPQAQWSSHTRNEWEPGLVLLQPSACCRALLLQGILPKHPTCQSFVCPSCSLPWGSRLCRTRAHIMFHPFATQ